MDAINEFVSGYMVAILWAERDLNREDENDDATLSDDGYTPEDFTDETRDALRADAVAWYWRNRRTLRAAYDEQSDYTPERAGHDYYFTQAGHGVGFWDRGLDDIGRALTDACRPHREFNLFTNDAGRVDMD